MVKNLCDNCKAEFASCNHNKITFAEDKIRKKYLTKKEYDAVIECTGFAERE